MQINITGHNVELTPPLKEYALKKIGKLKEFYANIIKAAVVLDVRSVSDIKRSQVAEVSMWLSGKKVVRATEAGENMYAAIDMVYEELKRQVQKHKDKHVKEVRREGEKIKEITRKAAPLVEIGSKQAIARMKKLDISTMTSEEALEEQKKSDQEFLLFRNADTGDLNIAHKSRIITPGEVNALSEEQAESELAGTEAPFLPFLNRETNEMNVIYRRRSGNLGLIEPAA